MTPPPVSGLPFQSAFAAAIVSARESDRFERIVKVREVIVMLRAAGWREARTRGSHPQFNHPEKPGVVTVPGNAGDDLAVGTLLSIFKQAGIKP